jgi:DNA-binding transcriptional MerR regulator
LDNELLTIAEIAKQLNIPESTARFYRDRFETFIPMVGTGRNKRYRPETADVLRYVAEAYKRNEQQWQIEEALSRMVARNIDIPDETAPTAVVAQQQQAMLVMAEQFQKAMGQIASAMETVAEQKKEISELREHVSDIEQQQIRQNQYIEESLTKRDQQLMEALREIREAKQKKWWHVWK